MERDGGGSKVKCANKREADRKTALLTFYYHLKGYSDFSFLLKSTLLYLFQPEGSNKKKLLSCIMGGVVSSVFGAKSQDMSASASILTNLHFHLSHSNPPTSLKYKNELAGVAL